MMKTLGIIGGLGPMATAYFMELLVKMTDAEADQEHLDIIAFSRPDVPDRTAYILDKNMPSPLISMKNTAKILEQLGVCCICSPCVTAHYLYNEISSCISVPYLNMVTETAHTLKLCGKKKIGIMGTTGTVSSMLFQTALEAEGIAYSIPDDESQADIMHIIYKNIKAGLPVELTRFDRVFSKLVNQGCDAVILGCTELSLIKRDYEISDIFIDSLEVLSKKAVEMCGKSVNQKYFTLVK